ncbi:hypothetical protein [Clostridium sp. JS66]|uniref:hypothetical protein n=1 Tax=Clostridium sp. JS66 TaxID=3064705 RepID=UPI00298EB978|nr:hypothetical protein [Clostridium sp. JS66]WPC42956.1 hypothetical protein Q6H37_05645 [Clostridium sp. JS66]
MSGINRVKYSKQILKALTSKGLMKDVVIKRNDKNDFGEKQDDLEVCTVKGYYYKNETKIVLNLSESGTINDQYNEKLLIVFNDGSKDIKQDDYFVLNDIKYKIIDTGNIEDIVLNMTIDRM